MPKIGLVIFMDDPGDDCRNCDCALKLPADLMKTEQDYIACGAGFGTDGESFVYERPEKCKEAAKLYKKLAKYFVEQFQNKPDLENK